MAVTAVDQAKDLLSLVAAPLALATGTLLVLANRAIKKNGPRVDFRRMVWATLASTAAVVVTATLLGLMAPLALRSLFIYRGSVEAALVVYWIIFLSVVGSVLYSVLVLRNCALELKRSR